MTSKEKAKEIYGMFFRKTPQPYTITNSGSKDFPNLQFQDWDSNWTYDMALGHSLIHVDEILKLDIVNPFRAGSEPWHRLDEFWNDVRTELIELGNSKMK